MGSAEEGSKDLAQLNAPPRHIAIIMDGNGRWAEQRSKPRHAGHKAGVKSVRSSVEQCVYQGVEVLTLFAFSSENWKRPKKEVSLLMDLFMIALQREVRRLKKNNVRLRIIGELSAFSDRLRQRISKAEAETAGGDGLVLQIAANYGGRWDITQASRRLARRIKAGEIQPDEITEESLSGALSCAGLPDPELFIRTGGEQRISNFLLWQAAYSELYFTDTLWPDFDAAALQRAIAWYTGRLRRFGKTSEQVLAEHARSQAEG